VHNDSGTATFTNCVLSGNTATGGMGSDETRGGAAYGGAISSTGTLVVTNCSVAANTATGLGEPVPPFGGGEGLGGGISSSGRAAVTVSNCILWANRHDAGTDEAAQVYYDRTPPSVVYSCIQGLSVFAGDGNVDADPWFVRDPDDGGDGWGVGSNDDFGDVRLLPSSPCLDAGDNAAVPPDTADLDGDADTAEPTPLDLAGDARFHDDPATADTGIGTPPIVDMGAYEGPALPTLLAVIGGSDATGNAASLIRPKAEEVGLAVVAIEVDQPVSYVGASVITTAPAGAPDVTAFTHIGGGIHRIELDASIPVGHWTVVTLTVAGVTGGESAFEVCLGHLPADVNADGEVNMADATAFGSLFGSDPATAERARIDLNGDGQTNLNDATLLGQLWQGTNGHSAWQGESLPPKP